MNTGEILIYENINGNVKIDVRLEDETVWLMQAQMGQLFGKGRTTITEHIGNIFKEGELSENSVVRKFRTTAHDGNLYNLEVVCRNFRHTTQHGAIEGKTQERNRRRYKTIKRK